MIFVLHGARRKGPRNREYNVWSAIKARCLNPKDRAYPRYGGRGIRICDRWLTFQNFLEDMGPRPPGTSIERLNNDGHYEPGNCKWATPLEQGNNKRNNRLIEFEGRRMTIAQWGREHGLPRYVIRARISQHGWSIQRALTTPLLNSKGQPRQPQPQETYA